MDNNMKPKDVGAPVLIPQGNLDSPSPASYAGMLAALNNSKTRRMSAATDYHKGFRTGYFGNSGVNYNGHDQSVSWIPFGGK